MSPNRPTRPHSGKQLIAGVRFQPSGKVYHFDASRINDLRPGDFALVETVRGTQLGRVVNTRPPHDREDLRTLKPIKQRATGRELALRQWWQQREKEALEIAREEAESLNIPIKVVLAEYTLDGKRLDRLPASQAAQARVQPGYESFPGWEETTSGARSWAELPAQAIKYVRRIEELIEAPVALLSTSPERDDTILVHNPFQD